ncbi:MFS transporter [Nocardioides sp. CPCC 205120]|uniref:MFS transporter n=1 Tax=Nocardioides sp. CPCC 205120 TaxID=3406462 RepID=UPI003B5123C2
MPAAATSVPTPGRARLGVSAMFFTNGVLYSALLPRYPEIKAALGLSNTEFGIVVVAFPAGAILAAASAAPAVRRLGVPLVTAAGSALLAVAMAVAGWAPSVLVLVAALLVGGVVDAVVDAAQNVHGVAVERWRGRSIINSLHAVWSLGAATGGLVGAGAAAASVPIAAQMAVNGVVWSIVAVVAARLAVIPAAVAAGEDGSGGQAGSPGRGEGAADADAAGGPARDARRGRRRAWRLLAPVVLLAVCGTLVEDVASNWSVLYLGTEAGAPARVATLTLTVVLTGQLVGRLLGDRMTDRWGRDAVARSGGLLIAAGMAVAVAAPPYPFVLAGFALMGFGSATLVPAAFAAADRVPGLPAGTGIAVLGWLMRLGFLVTSPVVGAFSDATSLRLALLFPLAAGLLAAALAHRSARSGGRARRG